MCIHHGHCQAFSSMAMSTNAASALLPRLAEGCKTGNLDANAVPCAASHGLISPCLAMSWHKGLSLNATRCLVELPTASAIGRLAGERAGPV